MVVSNDVAEIGIRLLDDAYLAWLAAESEAENALKAWVEPGGVDRASAYCAYRAAVDREEAAARDLKRLWELAGPCRETLARREPRRVRVAPRR
jgi:hypothetical protein